MQYSHLRGMLMAHDTDDLIDAAEFVFGSDEPVPLTELADSFLAIDWLFARSSRSGARLAVTEIRRCACVQVVATPESSHSNAVKMAASNVSSSGNFRRRD